jgi:hypothetical protein
MGKTKITPAQRRILERSCRSDVGYDGTGAVFPKSTVEDKMCLKLLDLGLVMAAYMGRASYYVTKAGRDLIGGKENGE